MSEFMVPPHHTGFKAKKLYGEVPGCIADCAVAYIEPRGGGPSPSHTHAHDHFFIVVEGCATIQIDQDRIQLKSEECLLVPGAIIHSIWNETDLPLKMIGMTIVRSMR